MQKIEVEIQKKSWFSLLYTVHPRRPRIVTRPKICPEEYFMGNEYLEITILKANTSRHLIINPALGLYRPLCSIEGV